MAALKFCYRNTSNNICYSHDLILYQTSQKQPAGGAGLFDDDDDDGGDLFGAIAPAKTKPQYVVTRGGG